MLLCKTSFRWSPQTQLELKAIQPLISRITTDGINGKRLRKRSAN